MSVRIVTRLLSGLRGRAGRPFAGAWTSRAVLAGVVLAGLGVSGVAWAYWSSTGSPTHIDTSPVAVFDVVTSVETLSPTSSGPSTAFVIRGQGAGGAPLDYSAYGPYDGCQRAALLMMTRPGRFRLTITGNYPETGCRLEVR